MHGCLTCVHWLLPDRQSIGGQLLCNTETVYTYTVLSLSRGQVDPGLEVGGSCASSGSSRGGMYAAVHRQLLIHPDSELDECIQAGGRVMSTEIILELHAQTIRRECRT